ncbi:alpha-amylase family glycosyl hydrolase, partial [Lachnospiraceae bacterium HCP1S3_D4]
MRKAGFKKVLALSLAVAMTGTTPAFGQNFAGYKATSNSAAVGAGVATTNVDAAYKFMTDSEGKLVPTEESRALEKQSTASTNKFSWDNATVYFLLTDRFKNGDTTNDNAYGRKDHSNNFSDQRATFHGGDFAGITQKIEEGYFDDLGVNAIWLSAPYEQIHGYIQGGKDGGKGYYHQSYHGYYVLDYTESDEAFGTKEEFKTLVDTAHKHGIRIVMDIVMNHSGYNSIGDMNEFGFGTLKDGWDTFYNGPNPEAEFDLYHDNYVDYKSSEEDWANWWGTDWVRSGLPGYSAQGDGSALTQSLAGLPDFKTESTKTVGIPKLLENKWKKEGTYAEKVAKYGTSGTVRSYLCKWLSEWVETYGVDGFRCDTAKHVEYESWKALKDSCVAALKKWRQNNPTAPGADWTDDFWMTGEAWDHGVGKDAYYTEGGFDSMINFATCGGGGLSSGQLDGTYSGYAAQINSDPTFNVLSFMSSHDEMVMGGVKSSSDMIYYGTAFLMLPGGVQIYYGDETHRGLVPGASADGYGGAGHSLRSDMNWDTMDTELLAHWQKVGSFRNNHIAVGAGTHTKISSSPYTFSRVKGDDKVVVAMPNSAGTYEINVSGIFADDTIITDAYSGETYQVSGGKVSVTCDSNCTILLDGGGTLKPSVNASGKKIFTDETVTVKLVATMATDTYYSLNGGAKKAYNNGDTITIGAGAAYGEKFTVTLSGKAEDGTDLSNEAVFTKCDEPAVSDGVYRLKVKKSEFSEAPYIYVWQEDASGGSVKLNGDWPGAKMSDDGDYWAFEKEGIEGDVKFILSNGTDSGKYTGDMISSGSCLYTKDGKLTKISVVDPAKVICRYVDESGKDLTGGKNVYRVGMAGQNYSVVARKIPGYVVDKVEGNKTGIFTEEDITVTFVYKLSDEEETESTTKQDETPSKPIETEPTSKEDETTSKPIETEPTTKQDETTSKPIETEPTTKQDETTSKPIETETTSKKDETTSKQDETTSKKDETTSKQDETTSKKDETTSKQDETTSKKDET